MVSKQKLVTSCANNPLKQLNSMAIWLVLLLFCLEVSAKPASENITLRVINDKNVGILSKVMIVGSNNSNKYIGKTANDGKFSVEYSCKLGERIKANPVSAGYYHSSGLDCYNKNNFLVKVTSKTILTNLTNNAQWAESKGNNADAALIFVEIAARLDPIDKGKADTAAVKAYRNTAIALEYTGQAVAWDPEQGKKVLSTELAKEIKQFQESNKITANGQLNTSTLKALSGRTIGKYMFKDYSTKANQLP